MSGDVKFGVFIGVGVVMVVAMTMFKPQTSGKKAAAAKTETAGKTARPPSSRVNSFRAIPLTQLPEDADMQPDE